MGRSVPLRRFDFVSFDDDPDAAVARTQAAAAVTPEPEPEPPPPPPPSFSEAELAEAVARALAAGREDGRKAAERARDTALDATLTRLAATAEALLTHQDARDAALRAETVMLAIGITRRLFPALTRLGKLAEIEALVAACLEDRREDARLVIRVAEDLVEPVKARAERAARLAAWEGRLIFLGDERLAPGDALVEWADGGAERRAAACLAQIEATLSRALDAAGPPSAPPPAA